MDRPEPLLKVLRGNPTDEDLAALVGVLLTRAAPAPTGPDPVPGAWVRSGRPAGRSRLPAVRGPRAWPESARPR